RPGSLGAGEGVVFGGGVAVGAKAGADSVGQIPRRMKPVRAPFALVKAMFVERSKYPALQRGPVIHVHSPRLKKQVGELAGGRASRADVDRVHDRNLGNCGTSLAHDQVAWLEVCAVNPRAIAATDQSPESICDAML